MSPGRGDRKLPWRHQIRRELRDREGMIEAAQAVATCVDVREEE